MKKSHTFISFLLGLLISFPILFQSYHAVIDHIIEDDHCCSIHHHEKEAIPQDNSVSNFNTDEALCPILEYQLVYFLSSKQVLPEQNLVLVHDFKTPILEHPVIEYRDRKNKLRGPPLV